MVSPLDQLINGITIAGLAAFTVSGVIEAKRKDMDAFGCMSVAFVTALGGGTVRDVLLGRYPLFWISNQWYAIGIFALAAVLYYSARYIRMPERAILVPDALGLGLFSVTGATFALEGSVFRSISASPVLRVLRASRRILLVRRRAYARARWRGWVLLLDLFRVALGLCRRASRGSCAMAGGSLPSGGSTFFRESRVRRRRLALRVLPSGEAVVG